MTEAPRLFASLSQSLEADLRDANPWWAGGAMRVLPPFRRWAFDPIRQRLLDGLAPAVVVRGPRQVGKTTLLEQVTESLLADGVTPRRILRVQFDELPSLGDVSEPIVTVSRWFSHSTLGRSFNEAARDGEPAYLLFDEIQNLPDWAPQLKYLVDMHTVRVLVTGSSALRIEQGRDSLAGRLSTVDLGPLLLREVAALRGTGDWTPPLGYNGIAPLKAREFWEELAQLGRTHLRERDAAFLALSERGAYPVAQANPSTPWEEVADFLNETVVQRAIQHDLRFGERGRRRDEALLREVFRLCCRYAGQAPSRALYIDEIKRALEANVGWGRVLNYLRFLDGTLLVKLIEPLELRLKKLKGNVKPCLCDHALRASWLQERIPLAPRELAEAPQQADLAGHIAESVAGYFLATVPGLDVSHFPERASEPEVDFVLTIGDQRIPVEVKYRRRVNQWPDTVGLRSFIEKTVYNAPFGLLITLTDDVQVDDPRIVALPLSSLLMMR